MKRNRVGDKKPLPPGSPQVKKGPSKRTQKVRWTQEEDMRLQRTVLNYLKENNVESNESSISWKTIAERLTGRTGKQCRERWSNHVNPEIKTDPWTEEEEILIVQLQREKGNSWKDISQYLQGRSDNAIKNHWHSMRRRKHHLLVEANALGPAGASKAGGRILAPSSMRGKSKVSATGIKTITPRGTNKQSGRSAFRKTSAARAAAARRAAQTKMSDKGGSHRSQQGHLHQHQHNGQHPGFAHQPHHPHPHNPHPHPHHLHHHHHNGMIPSSSSSVMDHPMVDCEGSLSAKENLNAAFQGPGGMEHHRSLSKSQDIFLMEHTSPTPFIPTSSKLFSQDQMPPPIDLVPVMKTSTSVAGATIPIATSSTSVGAGPTPTTSTTKRGTGHSSGVSIRSMSHESISSLSSDAIMHGIMDMSSSRLTPDLARALSYEEMGTIGALGNANGGGSGTTPPPLISPLTLTTGAPSGMMHGANTGGITAYPKILQSSGELDDVSWTSDQSFEPATGSPIMA